MDKLGKLKRSLAHYKFDLCSYGIAHDCLLIKKFAADIDKHVHEALCQRTSHVTPVGKSDRGRTLTRYC